MVESFVLQSSIQGLIALGAASAAGLYFHIGWLQNEVTKHQRYIMEYLNSIGGFAFPTWEGSDRVKRDSKRTRMQYYLEEAHAVRAYFVNRVLDYFRSVKKDCLEIMSEAPRQDLRNLLALTFYESIMKHRTTERASDYLKELNDKDLYREESIYIFDRLLFYLPESVRNEIICSRDPIILRLREICYDAEIQVKELDKAKEIHDELTGQLRRYTSRWIIGPFLAVIVTIILISLLPSYPAPEYHIYLLALFTLGPLAYMGTYLGRAIWFIRAGQRGCPKVTYELYKH